VSCHHLGFGRRSIPLKEYTEDTRSAGASYLDSYRKPIHWNINKLIPWLVPAVATFLEEDSLPRQPIANQHRDLFHPEVRRFRAVVRQMVEAGLQRYGGTVGTHPRDARPELRDVVLTPL